MILEEQEDEDYGRNTTLTRQGGRRKGTCKRCGNELLKKNLTRHRGACGIELMRTRKTCQYCGKAMSMNMRTHFEIEISLFLVVA